MDVEEMIEAQGEGPHPKDGSPRPAARDRMPEWAPKPSSATAVSLAAALGTLACSGVSLAYASGRPIAIDTFAAAVAGLAGLLLGLLMGIMAYAHRSLRYRLTPEKLTIEWLWIRETIPLGRIEGVYGGRRLGKRAEVAGLSWPGQYIGRTRAEGLGRLKFYGTTLDPSSAVIVATGQGGYALTPAEVEEFRRKLIRQLEVVTAEEIEQAPEVQTVMPRLLRLTLLRDGVAVGLLAAALLVLMGSFGYVSARFPDLPELMPLHFNYAGEPDLIGPPRDAFRMPLIGLLILGANGVLVAAIHGWLRDAGRVLAAATVFVELVMLIAVLRVVH